MKTKRTQNCYKYLRILFLLVILNACSDNKQKNSPKVDQISTEKESKVVKDERKKILFFGDSLTAGYQLEEDESFPSLIQDKIDSLGMKYEVINGGLSGETTAGGKNRIDWVLKQNIDIFVLELGPNDALRGFDLNITKSNLKSIIDKVLEKSGDIPIIIAGMEAPPNMGDTYTGQFRSIYSDLAKTYSTGFVPFLLDGVAGIPELNLTDGIHPNPQGQKIVAQNVWQVLKDYL